MNAGSEPRVGAAQAWGPAVRVERRAADRLRAGHLWVYRTDVLELVPGLETALDGGSVVTVVDARGMPLGSGLYSGASQIAVRMVSREAGVSRAGYLAAVRERLEAALALREELVPDSAENNACRLVFSEADGLPGIVVDRYEELAVVQLLVQGTARADVRAVVAEVLAASRLGLETVVERPDARVRELERLEASPMAPLFRREGTRIFFGNDNQNGEGNGEGKGGTRIPFGNDNQRGEGNGEGKGGTQIPFGNDNQKGKDDDNGRDNYDGGTQIPFGNDKQKGKDDDSGRDNYNDKADDNGEGGTRIPFGSDNKKGDADKNDEGAGRLAAVFTINGLRFHFDAGAGQKTGAFLDQRLNYAAAAEQGRGEALDVCTYQGGFALHLAARCARVTGVDASRGALEVAERNLQLNPQLTARVDWIEADAFELLREFEATGRRYDTIVLDPPAFAKSKRALDGALRGYKELNLRAMKMLRPGGRLVTCSCSHHVSPTAFTEVLAGAAADAGRRVQVLEARGAAPDHPAVLTLPETSYLKCLICRVG